MRKWEDAVKEHMERVLMAGYREEQILGIFLYGSQNYGLASEDSDIDTKAIIIPTLIELGLGKPVSRELHLDNGEHCEVKDIRELVDMFKKQNINYVEILFTDYCWINPKYEKLWKKYFLHNAEEIAHYNEQKCVISITGQALHTLHQIKENQDDKVNGKKFANALRLYWFFEKYIAGANYIECITNNFEDTSLLLGYKRGGLEVTDKMIDDLALQLNKLREGRYRAAQISVEDKMKHGIMALLTNDHPLFDFYKEF